LGKFRSKIKSLNTCNFLFSVAYGSTIQILSVIQFKM